MKTGVLVQSYSDVQESTELLNDSELTFPSGSTNKNILLYRLTRGFSFRIVQKFSKPDFGRSSVSVGVNARV